MKIIIGSDHGAFENKKELTTFLETLGHEVLDVGTHTDSSCHYPVYAKKVVTNVLKDNSRGIILCGSGVGVSMVANRFSGIRAVLCQNKTQAELSRQHNDSNILCMGGRLTSIDEMKEISKTWIESNFEGDRHSYRISMFDKLGEKIQFGINSIEKHVFSIIFIVLLMGLLFARVNLKYFNAEFTREDGFIEWATFFALTFGSYLSFKRFFSLIGKKNIVFLFCTFILGCLFLFGAGEEISWGQRMFGFSSGHFFAHNNAQGETNLHNMMVNGKSINKLVFGKILGICIALYLLVLPWAYRKFSKLKSWVDSFAIPVPKYFHVVAYIGLVLIAELTGSHKKGEILEFGGCCIFFMLTLYPFNDENFKA